jgi:uncharacterized protein YmfQ (DUF2313 family)
MDVAAYARQLVQLLPPGPVWRIEADSNLSRLLAGVATEFARVDGRAVDLLNEFDPRTTYELLAEWERVYGLPDPCLGDAPSLAQRRASLIAKVIATGQQTPASYIAIAAALGFTVTITEFMPFTVDSDVDAYLYDDAWAYAWQVNAPLQTVGEFDVESSVDDPLAWWGNDALECVLLELKPAHTHLIFSYS